MTKALAIVFFVPCTLVRCVVDAAKAIGWATKMEWRALKRILRR